MARFANATPMNVPATMQIRATLRTANVARGIRLAQGAAPLARVLQQLRVLTESGLAGASTCGYNALFARKLHGRILPALFFCLIDFAVVPLSRCFF